MRTLSLALTLAASAATHCQHACSADAAAPPPPWSRARGPRMGIRVARPARYETTAARRSDKINVHIIPHTHDDVGWLKTVDQYVRASSRLSAAAPASLARYPNPRTLPPTQFYGANNSIQHANVHSIIDAMIGGLLDDPSRRFIYVEQAFFQRWYAEQPPAKRASVAALVASGQLEFINGGWSMHDESAPSFVDMIDNTALGARLIFDAFGVSPRTTWQIDPFGHSVS